MFSSDNGPWLIKGKDGGEAGPLRGGKGSTWEGGVRVPTLAWWPGKIAPSSVCDAIAGNIDFLPTFVKIADGAIPSDNKIDGKDISPLLLGQTKESPHEARYYYSGYKLQAVRVGPWKLAIAPQPEHTAKNDPAVFASLDRPRLYNLDADIGEQDDVAEKNQEVVARLKALASKMAAELGDGKPGPEVREAGHVDNPVTLFPVADDARKSGNKKNAKSGTGDANRTTLDDLKVGDTVASPNAPQVAGKTITITCEVETKARNGVIVAHGGVMGYTLYLNESHVVFAVHLPSKEAVRATSPSTITGKTSIEARLGADGAMTLSLDGKQVASGNAGGPLPRQPAENFCVGHDDKVTVDHYDGKARLQAVVSHLRVQAGDSN